jgi:lipopolysaccharide transport system ATP-binding protein
MCSDDIAIRVSNVGKCFRIYGAARDRLKQFVMPRLRTLAGQTPKQYFREFWALSDISIEIRKGETVGIIGRNGSGKSTLLQIICGTLHPTGGEVETNGRVAALLELGSGFNPEFSGRENVYMNASVLGLRNAEIDARFDRIAAFADIGDFIEQPAKTYSSGMLVRLAFAVIAHVDADILVVDEALAVGDAFFALKCMRFLREFMKTGTVLFVSHDTGSVKNLCSRAIWLEQGRVVRDGAPKEVCEYYLEAFYEAQRGARAAPGASEGADGSHSGDDARSPIAAAGNLRSAPSKLRFNPHAGSFGTGWAKIQDVSLLDANERPLARIAGGERVTLRVVIHSYRALDAPIIGFFVNDRLGQALFGDNTFAACRERPVRCGSGEALQADFMFHMPLLPAGEYSITISVANGTQDTHEQHHWIHDAVVFSSESRVVASGLIGIPMLEVRLQNSGASP